MALYKRGKFWWIDEVLADGKRCQKSTRQTDRKHADDVLGRERERAVDRLKGRPNHDDTNDVRPTKLVEEYVAELERQGCSRVHVNCTRTRLLRFASEVSRVADLTPERIRRTLSRLAGTPLKGHRHIAGRLPTPKTLNEHRGALHGFFAWLVEEDRWDRNPVAAVKRVEDMGPEVPRRALSAEEFDRLFASLLSEPKGSRFGPARAVAYLVAANTGFRRSELLSLAWSAVDLDAGTVRLKAKNAKNRRALARRRKSEEVFPLNAATVAGLKLLRGEATEDGPVFSTLPTVETLREDLSRAKDEKGVGIAAENEDGKIDFHALRTTFGTWLAREGVGLALAQKLMRHSTPTLTSNVYSHLELHDGRAAVAKLTAATVGENVGTEGPTWADMSTSPIKEHVLDSPPVKGIRSSSPSAERAGSEAVATGTTGPEVSRGGRRRLVTTTGFKPAVPGEQPGR